ncbi:methionine ABC transporter ATP-binding protein [Methylosinus sp. PW1]|uniref:methionine ABC transporter ATP-binding protein n=1 Tax=Methylosinus sp. PW1 TaxID=107636 RepID=UPI00056BFBCB
MNAPTFSFDASTLDSSSESGPPPVVRLREVTKRFGGTIALDQVSLSIRRGEVLGLIGRSGAGKSTLIRCLNGLERPDSGDVEIEGRSIIGLSERELQPFRRRIGIVFQHFNLMSAKTVAGNIALPLEIEGQPRAARKARVAELLDLIGLADKASAYPAQLSGGQKQRVGIARALAARPALLLSDEATSALDPETTDAILELLRDINRKLDLTILLVTHEMSVVRAIADRVAVLDGGRIVEEGPSWRIFASPGAATTRSLLRAFRPTLPDELAARLVPGRGERTLLKIVVIGAEARAPLLADLALATGLRATLVHGGVDRVNGEEIGALFLEADGRDQARFSAALDYLRQRASGAEVLGHVAGDD